jgi:hypothetical protein
MLLALGCTRRPGAATKPARAAVALGAQAGKPDPYIGDAACAPCHPAIARQHGVSAHATTLAVVTNSQYGALFQSSQRFDDAPDHETYRLAVEGHRCVLVADGANGNRTIAAELAVGSGHDGVTFLGHVDPVTWVTLRLSYYAAYKRWRFSPNQGPGEPTVDMPEGRSLAPEEVALCIRCHVTDLHRGAYDLDLAGSRLGVGCEACHGPGRAHTDSARAMATGATKRIVPMDGQHGSRAAQVEQICARCHSTSLDTSHTDQGTMDDIVRFEATALEASRCFQKSKTLSCVNCHDPHSDVSHNRAGYEAVCLGCHGGKAAAESAAAPAHSCPVNPRTGCIGCHMPASVPKETPSHPFHNHWIRVWPRAGGKPSLRTRSPSAA